MLTPAATLLCALMSASRVAVVASASSAPGQATLQYAERDAARMADVLRELGGFSQVWSLRDPTPAAWDAAFDRVEALAQRDPEVELVVFYSGHADAQGLLLGPERVSYRALRARLDSSRAAVRVVILDACHAGGAARPKGGAPSEPFAVDAAAPLSVSGSAILAASAPSELAQESSELEGSFFTHHLLSALRGAGDRDGNGAVTLAEAYDYTAGRTTSATLPSFWGPQHPVYEYQLAGTGDMVLTQPTRGASAVTLGPGDPARYFVATSGHEVVAELSGHPSRRTRLALPPGRYRLVRRLERQAFVADVTVAAGEERRVEDLSFRATPPARALAKGAWVGGGAEVSLGLALTSLGPGALGASGEVSAGAFWRGDAWAAGTYVGVGQTSGVVSEVEYHLRRTSAVLLLVRRLPLPWVELRVGAGGGGAFIQQRLAGVGHAGLAGLGLGALTLDVPLSARLLLRTLWAVGVEVVKLSGELRFEPEARASLGVVFVL